MPTPARLLRLRFVRWLWLGLSLIVCGLWSSSALAGTVVIEPGREKEVLALLEPFQLSQEVSPGWKLWNVVIRPREISLELHGPGDPPAKCLLGMRHFSERDSRTVGNSKNFSFYYATAPAAGCRAAGEKLMAAVRRNEEAGFWRHEVESREVAPEWMPTWEWVLQDPLFRLAGFVALVVGMLTRELIRLPPRWRLGMLAVLALGVVLRLTLTPAEAAFDAWPFSRVPMIAAQIWHGPYIGKLSQGSPYFLTEIIFKVGLVFGLLGPAVVFMHAWRMLGSHRAAVFAGGLIAIWPSHIRFSHADGTFISSIVFSGMSFALAHDALRHPSRNWRWCALGLLVPVGLETFRLRPLNQIFAVLLVGAALMLGEGVPRARRLLVAGVVSVATLAISVPEFLRQYSNDLHNANSDLLFSTLRALFSYRLNTLIRVDMTPPLALVMAVVGAVALWRSRRRVALFLLGWLGLFFITHSIIKPDSPLMQARYHLHLIVPFALLAAAGLDSFARRRRRLGWTAASMLLLSPLVHQRFIRDVDVNQPAEHAFVMTLRKAIPEDCSVLEYVGDRPDNSRITRLGLARYKATDKDFYQVLPVRKGEPNIQSRIADARSRPCAMAYLGIECFVDGDPAPQCLALRNAATGVVREETRDNVIYDGNNTFTNPQRERFTMGLYDLTAHGLTPRDREPRDREPRDLQPHGSVNPP
ncbi:MAG: hypothetical protein KC766_04235 [Myxococcales bacterium]|nr:hypothetical protein [Myxococcales bacterium]